MISVVIPAYNEENAIEQTVAEIKAGLTAANINSFEIIVVNDCSSDNTGKILDKIEGVTAIHHPHNMGYGRSLKDGIKVAKNEYIVITDADGTYPNEKIPELYLEIQNGFDMVVGARQGSHYKESWMKFFLRRILKFLVEFTSGREIPDINSGLRIFRRKDILKFFPNLCNTFSFTTSATLAYMMTAKFVKYIPIEYEKRIGKTKVKLFKDSLRTLQFILEAILFYNPIKIFLVVCALMIITSLICFVGAYALQFYSLFLIGVGMIISSSIVFALGLVCILLSKSLIRSYGLGETYE